MHPENRTGEELTLRVERPWSDRCGRALLSEEQIIAIVKEAEAGATVLDVCRRHGISAHTFYRWRAKYGGMEASNARRLKDLDDENRRLKQIRALEEASELYGSPRSIIVDNGPEFASKVLDVWCYERGIELVFIRPGKPIENAYAESFNVGVREECLNQHAFESVSHARSVIESWCEDYNAIRPHSSLGGLAPEELLARWASAQTPQPTERAAAVEASVSMNPVPIPYP